MKKCSVELYRVTVEGHKELGEALVIAANKDEAVSMFTEQIMYKGKEYELKDIRKINVEVTDIQWFNEGGVVIFYKNKQ